MKKKITVLTLCAMLFALRFSAEAQQPSKLPRIGYLSPTSPSVSPARIEFEFIINLKAAKRIGLTIPPNVLVRADKVIR